MAPGRLSVPTFKWILVFTAALVSLSVTSADKSESDQTPAHVSTNSTSASTSSVSASVPPAVAVASSRVGEIARIRIVYGPKVKQADAKSTSTKGKKASKEISSSRHPDKAKQKQPNADHKYATIEPVGSGSVHRPRIQIYAGSRPSRPRPRPASPPPPPRPKLIIRPHPHTHARPHAHKRPRVPVAHVRPRPASPSPQPQSEPEPVHYSPHPSPQPLLEPVYHSPSPPPQPPPEKVEVFVVSEEQVRAGPVILKTSSESQSYAPAPHPPPSTGYDGGYRNYPSSAATAARTQFHSDRPHPFEFSHEYEHRQHSSQSYKYDRPGSNEPSPGFQPQQQVPGELSDSFGLSSYDRRPPPQAGSTSAPVRDYTQGREQPPPRIPVPVRSHDGTFTNMHAPIPGRNENGLVHPTYTKNYWLSGLNTPQVVLEDLKIIDDSITLSGFSSGGGMAQQLLMSYPSLFRGIAVFQQTYYRCGRGNGDITEYDMLCTSLGNNSRTYDPSLAINDVHAYFHNGLIEDPRNLRDKLLYVYAGLQNEVFQPEQMLNTIRIFEPYIENRFRIRTRVQDAANLLPTDSFGGPCDASAIENHFIGNCQLNGPFEALGFLLGEDIIKLPDETVQPDLNSLLEFDQSEFFEGVRGPHFMARTGYLYVPDRCGPNGNQRCHFHVYFHGCRTGKEFNDGNHIRHSGFLQLAELNDVIVMFPQIQRHERNPLGCWDTYGSTGSLYATQKGVQISIIRKMLARVLGADGTGVTATGNEDNELAPAPLSAPQQSQSMYRHVS